MKNLLSNWSGRLLAPLFPAALVACFLAPSSALAVEEVNVRISMGGGGGGGSEGDPLDTNDYGGGDGGSEVHNDSVTSPVKSPWEMGWGQIRVLLVPEFVGGRMIFKIMVIDVAESAWTGTRGIHAP